MLPLIFTLVFPLLGFCNDLSISSFHLPNDLLYQEKSIPDNILEVFFVAAIFGMGEPAKELNLPASYAEYRENILTEQHRLFQTNPSEDEIDRSRIAFEWQYIGTIHKNFHVVRVYYWEEGCWGKFTGLLILKRDGDLLKIVDVIYGGDRHSSMIFEGRSVIIGDRIIYHQATTTGDLIDQGLTHYLKQEQDSEDDSIRGCHGEAGYCGQFEKSAEINPDGTLKKIEILQFTPCEGLL